MGVSDAAGGDPRAARAVTALLAHPRYEVAPVAGVLDRAAELPHGATVAVTASPSRGVGATIEVVEELDARGFRPVPHLAARSVHDDAELAEVLERCDAAGVDDVFVVGGDAREPVGRFADGLSLLAAMERVGRPRRVGVPSYPDGHHRIPTETLWSALLAKQDHADYTVTQLCLDADTICRFTAEARGRGVHLPVVVGIPGVVDTRRLVRIGVRIGVGDSLRFLTAHRSTATTLLRPGAYRPSVLLDELGAGVAEGRCAFDQVHIYTFNQVADTVRWVTETQWRAAA